MMVHSLCSSVLQSPFCSLCTETSQPHPQTRNPSCGVDFSVYSKAYHKTGQWLDGCRDYGGVSRKKGRRWHATATKSKPEELGLRYKAVNGQEWTGLIPLSGSNGFVRYAGESTKVLLDLVRVAVAHFPQLDRPR